jgi:hypothetical protein
MTSICFSSVPRSASLICSIEYVLVVGPWRNSHRHDFCMTSALEKPVRKQNPSLQKMIGYVSIWALAITNFLSAIENTQLTVTVTASNSEQAFWEINWTTTDIYSFKSCVRIFHYTEKLPLLLKGWHLSLVFDATPCGDRKHWSLCFHPKGPK